MSMVGWDYSTESSFRPAVRCECCGKTETLKGVGDIFLCRYCRLDHDTKPCRLMTGIFDDVERKRQRENNQRLAQELKRSRR